VRAAVLHEHGSAPRAGDFPDPEPRSGHAVIEVGAAALHHVDLLKASGTFYMGSPPLPSVVGTDGVGRPADGRRVYFDVSVPPFGSMAERTLVPEDVVIDVPDGIGDALAAACGNTGLGAWLALTWRSDLQPGETVLVLGATGAVGTVAVQAAKLLGAGRVIAAARSSDGLERLRERGADAVVELDAGGDLAAAFRAAAGGDVHVTIDTLWGEPALAAIQAAGRHARHLQVGQIASLDIALPAPALRSVSLDLRGFSVAHPPVEIRRQGYAELTAHVGRGDIAIDVDELPLERIGEAWARQAEATGGPKLVLRP